jgi:hypothetical protein
MIINIPVWDTSGTVKFILVSHGHIISHQKRPRISAKPLFIMAGEEGFEPPLAESESAVLPLDDSPMYDRFCV